MSFWDNLDARYSVILCDIWGVVHDGVQLYPNASERLREWRGQGRCVVLLTNAPRTAEAVREQLQRIGLPEDCWDAISTSGEAGITALKALGRPVGFIGTASDRAVLEGRGVAIAADDQFTDVGCTGLREGQLDPRSYGDELRQLASRSVRLHCLNPDRVVVRGGVREACAGALADIYEALGGEVTWYGKPFPAIYAHALSRAGNPPREQVLAVGDSLQTDILGAAKAGLAAVFVAGGIHAGEKFPDDFAAEHQLGDWRPVAVVDGLA
ncbi:MAG TPA: TIGR01459 family HAD-type hydrolase [Sphingomicrobium sp.]|jgi:HAD superfamily hydrolase (TIGR01459 family)